MATDDIFSPRLKENITLRYSFHIPTLIIPAFIRKKISPKPLSFVAFHGSPISPTRSRIFAQVVPFFNTALRIPRFLDHLNRNDVLDGDMVFLHKQERTLRQLQPQDDVALVANPSTSKVFFTPAKSDGFVIAFRKWLRKVGQPTWAHTSPLATIPFDELPKEKLLDRYNQHTKHCSSCRAAHRNFKKLAFGLDVLSTVAPVAVLALNMLSFSASHSAPLSGSLSAIVRSLATNNRRNTLVTGMAAVVTAALLKLGSALVTRLNAKWFEYSDYVHAYRN